MLGLLPLSATDASTLININLKSKEQHMSQSTIVKIYPTPKKIENCQSMGWEYMGGGEFLKGDLIGYFTKNGFVKEET